MKIISTSNTGSCVVFVVLLCIQCQQSLGFTPNSASHRLIHSSPIQKICETGRQQQQPFIPSDSVEGQLSTSRTNSKSQLFALQQDLDVIALVAGQENYGLAIVCVGEALWSFLSAPSLDHVKVLIPAGIAAIVLVLVSGPMITSGDVNSVGTGLWIATATSTALGVSYIARMIASYSPSPKEIAFFGLIVAIAGFFSFAQNLFVDGFVVLPSLPTLPSLPSFEIPDLGSIVNLDVDVAPATKSVELLSPIELPTFVPDTPMEQIEAVSAVETIP